MTEQVDLSPDELLIQATCAVLVDGKISGTAWLVSDGDHLLTAGHILGTAKLERDQVEVRFADDIPRPAHKVAWGYQRDMGIDLAMLRCSIPKKLSTQKEERIFYPRNMGYLGG